MNYIGRNLELNKTQILYILHIDLSVHPTIKRTSRIWLVDKISSTGYPLHTEYFLTSRGKKMLQAVEIMQEIGIEYMLKHRQQEFLDNKGICYNK